MQTETNNWQAFSLATDALRDIDRFVSSSVKDRSVLVDAREKLKNAVEIDAGFSRAQYYSAIVDDMLGQPAKAASQLERLIASRPPFEEEAQYNLGVSYYHLYRRDEIEKAIKEFERVAQQTNSRPLKYMAKAGLIRSFAMMVLHSNLSADQAASKHFYDRTNDASEDLFASIKSDRSLDRKTRIEVEWRALNGRGVGRMFYSDIQTDLDARKTTLNLAQDDFEKAEKLSASNWEIVCNLGSVHMRLGVLGKLSNNPEEARTEFVRAHAYLQDVIDRIRPNYGFALYELGRVCRFESNFAIAKTWFEQSLRIPDDERNISERSLRKEIDKADAHSDVFP